MNDKADEFILAKQFLEKYNSDFEKLYRYVPYFMEKGGSDVARDYDGEQGKSDLHFPVYDGTLMSFVREAQKTVFMDKNYAYGYTRRHIRTKEQEEAAILNATARDDVFLNAVLTKYVTEGMRKSGIWQDAVERKLFLNVLLKYKEILDFYKRY